MERVEGIERSYEGYIAGWHTTLACSTDAWHVRDLNRSLTLKLGAALMLKREQCGAVTRGIAADSPVQRTARSERGTTWLEKEMNVEEKDNRNRKVRTLGNLTLVTKRLNSAMQNDAWNDKKLHLKPNSSLKMTVEYLDEEKWDESALDGRADDLAAKDTDHLERHQT